MRRKYYQGEQGGDPITKKAKELAEAMADRSRMNKDLLVALANAMAENEKIQRRFRNAVFIRLSRLETMVTMIHGAQIADAHKSRPLGDKMREHTKDTEEYISKHSSELGLQMVKYLYEDEAPLPKLRRKQNQIND